MLIAGPLVPAPDEVFSSSTKHRLARLEIPSFRFARLVLLVLVLFLVEIDPNSLPFMRVR